MSTDTELENLASPQTPTRHYFLLALKTALVGIIFFASLFLFCLQSEGSKVSGYRSDLRPHIKFTESIFAGTMKLPHPGLHVVCYSLSKVTGMPLALSFALILAASTTLTAYLLFRFLRSTATSNFCEEWYLLATALLMLVSAIYVPWYNPNIYLLQGSPNVWHNPTLIAAKPLAIVSFLMFISLLKNSESKLSWSYLPASLALLAGVLVKPNFALCFIPAVFLWLMIRWRGGIAPFARLTILVAPTVGFLLLQYLGWYGNNSGPAIHFDFLGVWRLYSPNPFISLLLAIAFPLALLLFRGSKAFLNHYLVLAFVILGVAVSQLACLAESERAYGDANFSWGYMFALQLVFFTSVGEYLVWIREKSISRLEKIKIIFVGGCFGLHLFSGVIYTSRIWSGGHYW